VFVVVIIVMLSYKDMDGIRESVIVHDDGTKGRASGSVSRAPLAFDHIICLCLASDSYSNILEPLPIVGECDDRSLDFDDSKTVATS
jgi:hypothetical protein